MQIKTIREFIKLESSGGIILVVTAALALILDNSPLAKYYSLLLSTRFAIHLGNIGLDKPLILWINDGLMAIFFLLVGMEIKREIIVGELSSSSRLVLPGIAAVGGMIVPAFLYIAVNYHQATGLRGWAIPTATDIAFALGILSILGRRIPVSLKIFLTALAILDDIGAIVIIAAFYSTNLSYYALIAALICVIVLVVINRAGIVSIAPYMIIGVVLWVCVLKSGVHATLAGVVVALCIPLQGKVGDNHSPLRYLEETLHPWVAYGVLPIFAFANAGISFSGITFADLFKPLPFGIAIGLFIGKQLGVFGATWLCIKSGLAKLPSNATWVMLYGISLLCGVGFTMSLFIGTLAFKESDPQFATYVRFGVLTGSLLSGIMGYLVLRICSRKVVVEDQHSL